MANKKWNRPYSKRLYDKIQGAIDKVNSDNERFEDVPVEVSDRDRYGKVQIKSYYEFYQSILFVHDKNDNLQPARMSSTHKDYV